MNNTPPEPVEPLAQRSDLSDTVECPNSAFSGEGGADIPQRIGDFTIVRILGEGGMGTVYLAEDVHLGRKAAIKTMKRELAARPENRVRFVREARAAAAVEHDNIVPIWQIGQADDGSPFIAMPFLQGEMLQARLQREPVQPLGIILKVAREVAEGLAAAHARGLIHRDIKPGNVWIEGDPQSSDLAQQVRRCKILDFGLARSLATEDVHLTASGAVVGTPAYMAPEQAGGATVDHRADLFSLGVMLYRMSTGRLPFAGPNAMAVLSALATITQPSARTRNKDLPQTLSDLIDRLLSKNPAGRPQSAADVATEVRQLAKEIQAHVSAPTGTSSVETRVVSAAAAKASENTALIEPEPATGRREKRGRTLLLVALGLLVLVPLGWWLATVIRRVETSLATVDSGDGAAKSIAPDRKTAEISIAPDRKAAEWVLSLGGMVRVNGQDREIKAPADLPPETFRLTGVSLQENKQVSDAGLAHFKDCKDLRELDLRATQVGDAGLASFKDCKGLTLLHLNGTKVSDAGLAHVRNCKDLTSLKLNATQVSDAGLALLVDCKNLTVLYLSETQVSDAGVAHLMDRKNLRYLGLQKTKVTAAKIEALKKALPQCKIEWDRM